MAAVVRLALSCIFVGEDGAAGAPGKVKVVGVVSILGLGVVMEGVAGAAGVLGAGGATAGALAFGTGEAVKGLLLEAAGALDTGDGAGAGLEGAQAACAPGRVGLPGITTGRLRLGPADCVAALGAEVCSCPDGRMGALDMLPGAVAGGGFIVAPEGCKGCNGRIPDADLSLLAVLEN